MDHDTKIPPYSKQNVGDSTEKGCSFQIQNRQDDRTQTNRNEVPLHFESLESSNQFLKTRQDIIPSRSSLSSSDQTTTTTSSNSSTIDSVPPPPSIGRTLRTRKTSSTIYYEEAMEDDDDDDVVEEQAGRKRRSRSRSSSNEQSFQIMNCPHAQCPKTFTRKSALRRHIVTVHEKRKNFACEYCGYKTHQSFNLARHVRSMHGKEASFKKGRKRSSSSPSTMNLHEETTVPISKPDLDSFGAPIDSKDHAMTSQQSLMNSHGYSLAGRQNSDKMSQQRENELARVESSSISATETVQIESSPAQTNVINAVRSSILLQQYMLSQMRSIMQIPTLLHNQAQQQQQVPSQNLAARSMSTTPIPPTQAFLSPLAPPPPPPVSQSQLPLHSQTPLTAFMDIPTTTASHSHEPAVSNIDHDKQASNPDLLELLDRSLNQRLNELIGIPLDTQAQSKQDILAPAKSQPQNGTDVDSQATDYMSITTQHPAMLSFATTPLPVVEAHQSLVTPTSQIPTSLSMQASAHQSIQSFALGGELQDRDISMVFDHGAEDDTESKTTSSYHYQESLQDTNGQE